MTDRLRRLDALFATKVLGKEIHGDVLSNEPLECWPQDAHYKMGVPLRPYTRSLDAAWEGARRAITHLQSHPDWCDDDRIDLALNETNTYEFGDPRFSCWFMCDHPRSDYRGESIDHPAEALVLACLRAVGVKEEELV